MTGTSPTASDSRLEVDTVLEIQLPGGREARYQIQIFNQASNSIIVLTDSCELSGRTMTSMIDVLATQILNKYHLHLDATIWIVEELAPPVPLGHPTYHLVQFNWHNGEFCEPRYCLLSKSQAEGLVGRQMPYRTRVPGAAYLFDAESFQLTEPDRVDHQ